MQTQAKWKRVKCPDLQKVTGARPTCYCCRKPLRPRTWRFEVPGRIEQAPEVDALAEFEQGTFSYEVKSAIKWGYHPSRVYRIAHRDYTLGKGERTCTELRFWLGTYDGYGYSEDEGHPLFCSHPCIVRFAVACWRAGMRMVDQKGNPR